MKAKGSSDSGERRTVLALLALGTALYSTALFLLPSDGDAYSHLKATVALENPLSIFVDGWFDGYPYYRPVHLVLLWLSYRFFGFSWWPQELLSVAIHLFNTWLVYRIVRRGADHQWGATLSAAFYLVSIYSLDTVAWIPARTNLFVGTCLLLLVDHILRRERMNPWWVAVLTVGALVSKESGVIVPVVAGCAAVEWRAPRRSDFRTVTAATVLLVSYAALRIALFGVFAADTSYEYRPIMLLGGKDLTTMEATPRELAVGYGETVVKNAVAVIVPIFNQQGLFYPAWRLLRQSPLWLLTPLLFGAALTKRPNRLSRIGWLIIALNAAIHFSFYSTYLLYLGQIGLCLALGAFPWELGGSRSRRALGAAFLVVLFFNTLFVNRSLVEYVFKQRVQIERWSHKENLEPIQEYLVERYVNR